MFVILSFIYTVLSVVAAPVNVRIRLAEAAVVVLSVNPLLPPKNQRATVPPLLLLANAIRKGEQPEAPFFWNPAIGCGFTMMVRSNESIHISLVNEIKRIV